MQTLTSKSCFNHFRDVVSVNMLIGGWTVSTYDVLKSVLLRFCRPVY